MYLLDTNAIREVVVNHPLVMQRAATAQKNGNTVTYSTVSHGEIQFGLDRLPEGQRRSTLRQAVSLVLQALGPPLGVDEKVANHYGNIKAALEKLGRPIPDNDIWLAATARHYGCILVTADAHFRAIDKLVQVNWLSPVSASELLPPAQE